MSSHIPVRNRPSSSRLRKMEAKAEAIMARRETIKKIWKSFQDMKSKREAYISYRKAFDGCGVPPEERDPNLFRKVFGDGIPDFPSGGITTPGSSGEGERVIRPRPETWHDHAARRITWDRDKIKEDLESAPNRWVGGPIRGKINYPVLVDDVEDMPAPIRRSQLRQIWASMPLMPSTFAAASERLIDRRELGMKIIQMIATWNVQTYPWKKYTKDLMLTPWMPISAAHHGPWPNLGTIIFPPFPWLRRRDKSRLLHVIPHHSGNHMLYEFDQKHILWPHDVYYLAYDPAFLDVVQQRPVVTVNAGPPSILSRWWKKMEAMDDALINPTGHECPDNDSPGLSAKWRDIFNIPQKVEDPTQDSFRGYPCWAVREMDGTLMKVFGEELAADGYWYHCMCWDQAFMSIAAVDLYFLDDPFLDRQFNGYWSEEE